MIESSPQQKRALLVKLLEERMSREARSFPLSDGQKALWFIQQLAPGSATYNVASAIRIDGPLKVPALRSTVQAMVDRHPSLRTTFRAAEASSEPLQTVHSQRTIDITEEAASSESWDELHRTLADEANRPFHLEEGPLLRVNLYRRSPDEHVLLLVMSHIIVDFWSMAILMREFYSTYTCYADGYQPNPQPLQATYKDLVDWESNLLASAEGESLFQYWKEKLSGELPVLKLPWSRGSGAATDEGGLFTRKIDKDLTHALSGFANAQGTTLFTVLLAAFQVLLYRYTSQEDLMIGTPVAGRSLSRFETIVGYFVNTVVVRAHVRGELTFRAFLQQMRTTVLDAFEHQDYPFPALVERLAPNRDGSHSPLFQAMFNMVQPRRMEQHGAARILLGDVGGKIEFSGLTLESLSLEQRTAAFDLTLTAIEVDEVISAQWHYKAARFDTYGITRVAAQFDTLLRGIVADGDRAIARLPLLTDADRQELMVVSRGPAIDFPKDRSFPQLFEEQVRRTPDAVAVSCEGEALTYRELNARSNRAARVLARNGIGRDRVVGIFSHRDINFLIAILAVFKAGGAYLPLDPEAPPQRTRHVLDTSGAVLVLAASDVRSAMAEILEALPPKKKLVALNIDELVLAKELEDDLPPVSTPADLAYVIFTSGSTGSPKGAMIEHRGMVNHLFAKISDLALTRADTIAQNAPQCFDISVWQFLAALLVGGRTHIVREETARDPWQLLLCVDRHGISILESVPSLIGEMLDAADPVRGSAPRLQKLRWLLATGEDLPPALCRRWFKRYPAIPLLNAYGPTECSDDVTHHVLRCSPPDDAVRIPIGRPIANMQAYVLDEWHEVMPAGIAGELYIGGIGVGRGYLNDPELTARAFTADRFSGEPGSRLYKTGDLARYRDDGTLEFLGRLDTQVKIRGQRIELQEIEAALAQHKDVQEVLVIPSGDGLIAYLVTGQGIAVQELRSFLHEKLPVYMTPSTFIFLESFPKNSSGKIDRAALPAPNGTRPELDRVFVAPRNAAEERLAQIWRELLKVDRVGVFDNFFDVGGHSLLAIQLLTWARAAFSREISNRAFFANPTVAGLAELFTGRPDSGIVSTGALDSADLRADAVLDPRIVPRRRRGTPSPVGAESVEPERILLTGATGFLGAHLLFDLLQQTRADVYCLVRARDSRQGLEKIAANLRSYRLDPDGLATRVRVVAGDLAEPLFGLQPAKFDELANEIDSIFHSGANVSFILPYHGLKPANVLGTQEVIKLACQGIPKALHHISTLAVCPMSGRSGDVIREEDDPVDVDRVFGGYAQSKWVAERQACIAKSRGLEVAIYRPGLITGHSKTGISNESDIMSALLKGCIQCGCAPMIRSAIEMTPVDYVSGAVVQLSRDRHSFGKVFHLSNPSRVHWNDLVRWVERRGFPVELIPFDDWLSRMYSLGDGIASSPLYPFLALLAERNAEMRELLGVDFSGMELPRYDCSRTLAALDSTTIKCPEVDEKVFGRYISNLSVETLRA